jgi:hypothetical protein
MPELSDASVMSLFESCKESPARFDAKMKAWRMLASILKEAFGPRTVVVPFGSTMTGFALDDGADLARDSKISIKS